MATFEQITELMRQNAEFMQNMQNQQNEQFRMAIGTLVQGLGSLAGGQGGGHGGGQGAGQGRGDLRERQFREISSFNGDESKWKEWSLKIKAAAKESNPDIFDGLKWAETEMEEMTTDDITDHLGEQALHHSTMLYNRLITHLEGAALIIHQTVPQECGYEVWRLLSKRYNPMTPMRGIQLMLKVMNPGKIPKNQDVQTGGRATSTPSSGTTAKTSRNA